MPARRYEYSFVGKLAGTVGVDQINARIPDDGPEGCAVPLQLVSHITRSQSVPIAISSTPGICIDPPLDSSGMMRLTRVQTSGGAPSDSHNDFYLEFFEARDRRLSDENEPDSIWRAPNFEKVTGPSCPGFESYAGRPLDLGPIVLSRADNNQQATVEPRQNQDGVWGYSAQLPADLLADGTVQLRGLGGRDVGPFETSAEFPPLRFVTDWSPGTTVGTVPLTIRWTGGDPNDMLRLSPFDHPTVWDRVVPVWKLEASVALFTLNKPLLTPGTILNPTITIEPANPGTKLFQAPGLTKGGRIERRMIYRFRGLLVQ
jgi:hypothetical protein